MSSTLYDLDEFESDAVSKKVGARVTSIDDLVGKLKRTQDDLEEARREIQSVNEARKKLSATNSQYVECIDKLVKKIKSRPKENLAKMQTEILALQERIKVQENTVNLLQETIENQSQEISRLEKNKADLVNVIHKQSAVLNEYQKVSITKSVELTSVSPKILMDILPKQIKFLNIPIESKVSKYIEELKTENEESNKKIEDLMKARDIVVSALKFVSNNCDATSMVSSLLNQLSGNQTLLSPQFIKYDFLFDGSQQQRFNALEELKRTGLNSDASYTLLLALCLVGVCQAEEINRKNGELQQSSLKEIKECEKGIPAGFIKELVGDVMEIHVTSEVQVDEFCSIFRQYKSAIAKRSDAELEKALKQQQKALNAEMEEIKERAQEAIRKKEEEISAKPVVNVVNNDDKWKALLEKAKQRIRKLLDANESLAREKSSLISKNRTMMNENSELKSTISNLQTSIDDSEQTIKELASSVKESETKNRELIRDNSAKSIQIKNLEHEMNKCITEKQRFTDEMKSKWGAQMIKVDMEKNAIKEQAIIERQNIVRCVLEEFSDFHQIRVSDLSDSDLRVALKSIHREIEQLL